MPCKINIVQENKDVKIIAMNPEIIASFIPEIKTEEITEIANDIKEILNNAK